VDAPDEVRAVRLGGIDTAVHRWGDPDGRPVVMLHSLGLDGASFGPVAAALTRQAPMLVLAPDLRGHGRSRAAPEQVEVRGMAADVVEFGQSLGIPALLVGQSMGSVVARFAAVAAPTTWAGVTLAAGPAAAVPAVAERGGPALRSGMSAVLDETLARWFTPRALAADGPEVRYARERVLAMDPAAWAAAWRLLGAFPDPPPLPTGLPGRCLAGDADLSSTPDMVRALRRSAGVTPEVVVLPEAPHQLFLERPDACAQALLDGWESPASRSDRDIRSTRIESVRPYR
jgi:pimeloyl-ACP methyl ester carboxylesterase